MIEHDKDAVLADARQRSNIDLIESLPSGIGGWLSIGIEDRGGDVFVRAGSEVLSSEQTAALISLLERSLEFSGAEKLNESVKEQNRKSLRDLVIQSSQGIGFVYLMRNQRNGYTKIGFSKEPKIREKTLQSEEPDLRMIAYWSGSLTQEKLIHFMYSHKRVRGEWFNLSKEEVIGIIADHPSAITVSEP